MSTSPIIFLRADCQCRGVLKPGYVHFIHRCLPHANMCRTSEQWEHELLALADKLKPIGEV